MLIFMFIAIMFVRTVVDQESAFQEECDKIYRVLDAEFENDFEEWQVELLKDLTIRFKNPSCCSARVLMKSFLAFKKYLRCFSLAISNQWSHIKMIFVKSE